AQARVAHQDGGGRPRIPCRGEPDHEAADRSQQARHLPASHSPGVPACLDHPGRAGGAAGGPAGVAGQPAPYRPIPARRGGSQTEDFPFRTGQGRRGRRPRRRRDRGIAGRPAGVAGPRTCHLCRGGRREGTSQGQAGRAL
ncbi:MAG: hypothetical protein AVDCRST_MAG75-105, partial [uncultured Propionibacteriaceae bacterium]